MLTINGDTYHIINLIPAAPGMYAQVDDNTFELVVMWAHTQKFDEGIDTYPVGSQPTDVIIGVTIVDLEQNTFTVHDNYTTNPPRDGQNIKLKR